MDRYPSRTPAVAPHSGQQHCRAQQRQQRRGEFGAQRGWMEGVALVPLYYGITSCRMEGRGEGGKTDQRVRPDCPEHRRVVLVVLPSVGASAVGSINGSGSPILTSPTFTLTFAGKGREKRRETRIFWPKFFFLDKHDDVPCGQVRKKIYVTTARKNFFSFGKSHTITIYLRPSLLLSLAEVT